MIEIQPLPGGTLRNAQANGRGLLSPVGNRMPPRQFIERQMGFRIAEREANDDVLTADLPPKPIR
jgi:hypothetical protein